MNKILIAEPIYHAMRPEVYFNRIEFWKDVFGDMEQGLFSAKSLVLGPRRAIRSARDEAIKTAIQQNATHLFFLDDDILVTPQILGVLLQADKHIIGGLMHRDDGVPIMFRDPPIDPIPPGYSADGEFGELLWLDHPTEGIFTCSAVGAGCMLIRVDTLIALRAELPEPKYLFNYDSTSRSMDVNFCRTAKKSGFGVWCWPDVPCTQVKHY